MLTQRRAQGKDRRDALGEGKRERGEGGRRRPSACWASALSRLPSPGYIRRVAVSRAPPVFSNAAPAQTPAPQISAAMGDPPIRGGNGPNLAMAGPPHASSSPSAAHTRNR